MASTVPTEVIAAITTATKVSIESGQSGVEFLEETGIDYATFKAAVNALHRLVDEDGLPLEDVDLVLYGFLLGRESHDPEQEDV